MQKFLYSCFEKIKQMFFNREFIFYLLIGLFNTFNGAVFSYLYSSIIPNANLAFVAGYITSLLIAYVLNSVLAFKQRLSLQKFIRFAVSYIPNFVIQNAVVFVFYNTLHWHKLLTYMIAAAVGVPVTFIVLKLFAFRNSKKNKS